MMASIRGGTDAGGPNPGRAVNRPAGRPVT